MYAKDSCDTLLDILRQCWILSFNFVKFEIYKQKHLQVTVCKLNFKMVAILFFHPGKFQIILQKHLQVKSSETEFQDGGHGGHLVFLHGTNFESYLV